MPLNDINFNAQDPRIFMTTLTAEEAAEVLKRNTNNRTVSVGTVAKCRADIEGGRYVFNGQTIGISKDGTLLDGQNRLTAHSQVPGAVITYGFCEGLDKAVQKTMDTGKVRSLAQQLQILGYKNSSVAGSGIGLYLLWKNGVLLESYDAKRKVISVAEVEAWLSENAELWAKIDTAATPLMRHGGSPTVAFYIAAYQLDPEKADEFVRSLQTLENLPSGSPILALNFRLTRARDLKIRLELVERLGYAVQAWNSWVIGKPMKKVHRPKNGWTKNNFPTLIDPNNIPVDAASQIEAMAG